MDDLQDHPFLFLNIKILSNSMIIKYTGGEPVKVKVSNIYGRKMVNAYWNVSNKIVAGSTYSVKGLQDDGDKNTSTDFTYYNEIAPANRTDTAYIKSVANTFKTVATLNGVTDGKTSTLRYPSYVRSNIIMQPIFDNGNLGRVNTSEDIEIRQAVTYIDSKIYGYIYGNTYSDYIVGANLPELGTETMGKIHGSPSNLGIFTYAQIQYNVIPSNAYTGNSVSITKVEYDRYGNVNTGNNIIQITPNVGYAKIYTYNPGCVYITLTSNDSKFSTTMQYWSTRLATVYEYPQTYTTTYQFNLSTLTGKTQNCVPKYNVESGIFKYSVGIEDRAYCPVLEAGVYKFSYKLVPDTAYHYYRNYCEYGEHSVYIYVNKAPQHAPEIRTDNIIAAPGKDAYASTYNGGVMDSLAVGVTYWSDGSIGNKYTLKYDGSSKSKTVRCYITGNDNFAASPWSNYVTLKTSGSTTTTTSTPPPQQLTSISI